MNKTAIVTGASGQDGSYLIELLIKKNYNVIGIDRIKSNIINNNLITIQSSKRFQLLDADLLDENRINEIIRKIRPDELYNLAAQSFVPASWNNTLYTCNINSLGVGRILEAIRIYSPNTKFYQASSSEMFGKVSTDFQDENTYHHPRSRYGC